MECTTFLNMERVAPPLGRVTHLLYNVALHGSILDLMFLLIYWGYTANLTIGDKGKPNHFLLPLDVPLKVFWPEGKMSIKANSKEEADFLGKVIISLGQISIPDVMSVDQTQAVAQVISKVFDSAWTHHAKAKQACACSKSWWDADCDRAKASAITSDLPANWTAFKKATHKAKCKHFDECIYEIVHTNLQPWDLMDWVGPCKTPPVKAILYQGVPCTSPDQLWNTLHSTFNSALDRPIDLSVLGDKWESPSIRAWILCSAVEMSDALMGTSNQSAPGLDHIMWCHLKHIIHDSYANHQFLWLANTCLQSGHWPAESKASTTVIIPKPGKL
jgi:hypothetical protein